MMRLVISLLILNAFFSACQQKAPTENKTKTALKAFRKAIEDDQVSTSKFYLLKNIDWILEEDTFWSISPDPRISKRMDLLTNLLDSLFPAIDMEHIRMEDSLEAYQFYYYRAFDGEAILSLVHSPQDIRMEVYAFKTKPSCNPIVGWEPISTECIQIEKDTTIEISEPGWKRFEEALKINEYWGLAENIYDDGIIDGSTWTIVGSRTIFNGMSWIQQHKSISRRSPHDYTGIYKIGQLMLEMSDMDWSPVY
ncbi:MAG: hypothetical protein GYB31_15250 [Bacteroidetes bacterium]|nr:hypothetical protein [Bacteroidota bacterium]